MKERVRDSSGQMTPKHVIAKKSLLDAVRQIQNFATNAATGSPRKIDAALFIFKGGSATEAIPFGPFNARAITDWVNGFSSFDTGTPLGNALAQAGDRVLKSNRAHKHVLVITDGMNTLGPDPAVTLPRLKEKAARQEASWRAAAARPSPSRTMPTLSHINAWSDARSGVAPASFSNGGRGRASSVYGAEPPGASTLRWTMRFAKTTVSSSELLARRFAP